MMNQVLRIAPYLVGFALICLIIAVVGNVAANSKRSLIISSPKQYPSKVDSFTGGVQFKIAGGTTVPLNKYPFFSFILTDVTDGSIPCGGSLIYPDIVLTAAKCIPSEFDKINVAINITNFDDSDGSYTTTVKDFIVHPEFDETTLRNDIALIQLNRTFPEDFEFYAQYNLNESNPAIGEEVTAIGFGKIREEAVDLSRTLQEVDIEIIDFDTCNDAYRGGLDEATQFCAGSPEGGKDSCVGDSGGPLMMKIAEDDIAVVGIVSGGNGCGRKEFPGFYTKVSAYSQFIENGVCTLNSSNIQSCNTTAPPTTMMPSSNNPLTSTPTVPLKTTSPSSAPVATSEPVTQSPVPPPVPPPVPAPISKKSTKKSKKGSESKKSKKKSYKKSYTKKGYKKNKKAITKKGYKKSKKGSDSKKSQNYSKSDDTHRFKKSVKKKYNKKKSSKKAAGGKKKGNKKS